MVGEPVEIEIHDLSWESAPGGNVEHFARHDVSVSDVYAVLAFGPLFYRSTAGGRASHMMVGRDSTGRSLVVYLAATAERRIWQPVTGWQSRLAHRLLESEGRI